MSNFKQLAGCADGWMINISGDVKSASGKLLQHSPDGKVTVKLANGNHRAVKVSELLERNFGGNAADSEAVNTVESNQIAEVVAEVTQEQENKIVRDLSSYSIEELRAEIDRQKLQAVDLIVEWLDGAKKDFGSEVVVAAVNKFLGD